MLINREWAMPSRDTFSIKPIRELCLRYFEMYESWVDPFVGHSPWEEVVCSNDLNYDVRADFHREALEFLEPQPDGHFHGVFFDPPYSPRQIKEVYAGVGKIVTQQDTQASWRSRRLDEAARVLIPGGISIYCGWDSNGFGKSRGFEKVEILLVPHGGAHNDTIVTVERKAA